MPKKIETSFCIICGDEGAKTLARCVKSILEPTPLVEEVVIGWNGKDDAAFDAALVTALGVKPPCIAGSADFEHEAAIRVVAFRQNWTDDFAAARNETFERATGAWRGYIDCDDVLVRQTSKEQVDCVRATGGHDVTGLAALFRALPPQTNCVVFPYHYAIGGYGEVLQSLPRRRFVRWADGYVWRSAVHEEFYPLPWNMRWDMMTDGLVWEHHPSESVGARQARNRAITERLAALANTSGHPVDARLLFDVASAAIVEKAWARAVEYLTRAISANDHAVVRDSGDALLYRLYLAEAHHDRGDGAAALAAAFDAMAVEPRAREPYFIAQAVFTERGQHETALHWFDLSRGKAAGLAKVDRPIENAVWPAARAAASNLALGKYDDALRLAREAVAHGPHDAFAQRTLERVTGAVEDGKAREAFGFLVDYLGRTGDFDGALGVRSNIPEHLGISIPFPPRPKPTPADPPAEASEWAARKRAALLLLGKNPGALSTHIADDLVGVETQHLRVFESDGRTWAACAEAPHFSRRHKRKITILVPHLVEPFWPDAVEETGCGGSEEAVVYLSRELTVRGHAVEVYTLTPRSEPRVDFGVVWRHATDFDYAAPRDVLIAHRAPWIVRYGRRAERTFVWHHDHTYHDNQNWGPEFAERAEHLYVSRWQREKLEQVVGHATRGWVIGNGIPPEEFAAGADAREPLTAVWASQPQRGLDCLLEVWPAVLRHFPEARLKFFYGWATAEFLARNNDDGEFILQLGMLRDLLHATPNVEAVGRVSQTRLAQEMLAAGVLPYTCTYPEVSCITGLRASAAGLVTCFPRDAALPETQYPESVWHGDADYAEAVLQAFELSASGRFDRAAAARWAVETSSWARVADRFEAALTEEP